MCESHSHVHHNNSKEIVFWAFVLTFSFSLLEIIFSFISNSLALLSEGLHMLSDGTSLFISLIAILIGIKAASLSHNFGYRRIEVIAAFVNGLALIIIPLYILWESIQRFLNHQEVNVFQIMTIGSIGLIMNIIVAFLLHKGSEDSINIKAAYLHVFADLLSSVATIFCGVLIFFTDFYLIDPIVSVIISIVIILSGIKITKQSASVLMEKSPLKEEYYYQLCDYLREHKIQLIHIYSWTITTHENKMILLFDKPLELEHRENILKIVNQSNDFNVIFSYEEF